MAYKPATVIYAALTYKVYRLSVLTFVAAYHSL